jgi:multiple sugar transport system ATP-binding protein
VPAERVPGLSPHENSPIVAGIRPEAFVAPNGGPPPGGEIRGEVTAVETLGHERLLMLDIDVPAAVTAGTAPVPDAEDGEEGGGGSGVVRARLPGLSAVAVGSTERLWFDPGSLYFFDPVTGLSVT